MLLHVSNACVNRCVNNGRSEASGRGVWALLRVDEISFSLASSEKPGASQTRREQLTSERLLSRRSPAYQISTILLVSRFLIRGNQRLQTVIAGGGPKDFCVKALSAKGDLSEWRIREQMALTDCIGIREQFNRAEHYLMYLGLYELQYRR